MRKFLLVLVTLAIVDSTLSVERPKLILLIAVDQMRGDYFQRFGDDFIGGFKRLASEGIHYTNADLNFATSETGPGHSVLSTGLYPAHNGIHGNEWIDPLTRREIYCVADSAALPVEELGGWHSPKNLLATGFGDWLKASSPSSKVISAAMKDRAAILMGGKRPDYAFWYDSESAAMVTSSYYTDALPPYVKAFNRSRWIESNVPDAWVKLLPDSVYERFGPDTSVGEGVWNGSTAFPHAFNKQRKAYQFLTSPYGDLMLLAFAQEIVKAERLGLRGVTDFLAIGLSCSDYVGHYYGPNSHEVHDHYIRVDRALGELFTFLDQTVGRNNYLVVLSADHGVCPLPEYTSQKTTIPARRIDVQGTFQRSLSQALQKLQREWRITEPLVIQNSFLNYAAAAKVGIDSITLERRVKEVMVKLDGVADVFFRRELLGRSPENRPSMVKFRNSYHRERGQDFQILVSEYSLLTTMTTGTTHGSPYRYDTHVPIIFWGAHLNAAHINRPVYTVDIAPTLAAYLGIPYPNNVDGKPLVEIVP